MKQIQLTFLLTLLMSMVGAKASAYNIAVENADGVTIYYNYINNDKELEVTYFYGGYESYYCSSLVIPDEVTYMNKTRKVTRIGDNAFLCCSSLTSITIPESVTSIGPAAFLGSGWYINQPDGIVYLDNWLIGHKGEELVERVEIVDETKGIADNAFYGCYGLMIVSIPNSVTSIGSEAFYGCSSLISVMIGNSVTSIGSRAFYGCSDLATVNIPNSVTSIGREAFEECSSLSSIIIPNSVTSIGESVFSGCSSLTSVTIPNSVTSIGTAFYKCSNLTKVNISDIAAWCKISFNGYYSNPLYYAHHLFLNGVEIKDLIIPNSVTSIGNHAFQGCSSLTSVTIPNSVTSIGDHAFQGCSSLTSVTIPNSVTSIGDYAFNNCGLTSIEIPNSINTIGECAFEGCSMMEKLVLPETLQIIKKTAFRGCSRLTNLTIPASVEFIYQEAFARCNNLEYVKALPETPPFLYDNSFSKYSITLRVPKGCKEAYQTAQGWKSFTNIIDADKYKLTYIVDNEEYKSFDIEEDSPITPEAAPTKEGYTFSGWSEIPETMPSNDVTITGTFSINKYKVTYIVDGVEYKSSELEFGSVINPEADPTKEGYSFSGWSEIPNTVPSHDVTITGSFTINKYMLTYKVDDVEYKIIEVEYGTSLTPIDEPTKTGYTFTGWVGLPEKMPAHDVTVVGSFSINSYKLTYILDGVEYKTATIEYGKTITPESVPTKEGYSFSGWNDLPETMPANDVTVTGSYTINTYKIVYMVDGVEYGTSEIVYGAEVNPIGEPSKEGYTFSGWQNLPEEMPAHDVTVSGTFKVNQYKVTFKYGKNVLTTIEVDYGAVIPLPESLNSDRYTLIEWLDVPDTMPARDIIIYADYVDGIETIAVDSKDAQYIQMNGMNTNDLKRGVNIIRTKDGKTMKVWVK